MHAFSFLSAASRFGSGVFSLNGALRRIALVTAVGLACASQSQAQTVLVTNLDSTTNNTFTILRNDAGGGNTTIAGAFTTGGIGALLDTITLKATNSAANGSGFSLRLYSSVSNMPGSLIEMLSSPSSIVAGNNLFTSSGTLLAPNTTYWLLTTSATDGFALQLGATLSDLQTGTAGWSIADGIYFRESDSGPWIGNPNQLQFTLTGTIGAVPEPSTYAAIAGGAMLGFAAWRRRHVERAAVPAAS